MSSTEHRSGRFCGQFIWRSTGFPCELLEPLALEGTANEILALLASGTPHPMPWSLRWAKLGPALEERGLRSRFAGGLALLRQRLHEIMRSPRFQLAVASSSPEAAAALHRGAERGFEPRSSRAKRLELLAMRYLQRFVTKCETSAFFGPVATGRLGAVDSNVVFRRDPSRYRPSMLLGTRYLGRVLQRLRRDPEILWHTRVERRSGVALGPACTIVHPRFGALAIAPRAFGLLVEASTPRTVAELLAGWPDARTEGLLAVLALLELGALGDDLEAAFHAPAPVEQLRRVIARSRCPEGFAALLDRLDDALVAWPREGPARRARWLDLIDASSTHAGVPSRMRHHGFYSDHLPIVEEGGCEGDHLAIDERWASRWLVGLEAAVRASLRHDAARLVALRRRLSRHPGLRGRKRVPLHDFVAELHAADGLDVGLDAADDVGDTGEAVGGGAQGPTIISPDVMIAARDLDALRRGEAEWILSECHSSVACAGFFVRAIPEPRAWLHGISAFLSEQLAGTQPVVVTTPPANKTSFFGGLSCARYLELGLAAPPGAASIGLDELEVVVDDGARLVVRGSETPVVLLPGPLDHAGVLQCFRTPRYRPLSFASMSRQRVAGPVVVRRARWSLDGDLPGRKAEALEVFSWAQHLRAAESLPRFVFAKPTVETKPICIDLSNPLSCEELLRLARREWPILVEEMHPSPADAWVSGPGGSYLGELRLLYASGAAS